MPKGEENAQAAAARAAAAQAATARADAVYDDAYQKAKAEHAAADQAERSDYQKPWSGSPSVVTWANLDKQDRSDSEHSTAETAPPAPKNKDGTIDTGPRSDTMTEEEYLAWLLEAAGHHFDEVHRNISEATNELVNYATAKMNDGNSTKHWKILLFCSVLCGVVSVFLYRAIHFTPVTPEPPVSDVSETHTTTSAFKHMARKTAEHLAVGAVQWVAWYVLDKLADGNS
tara:strand:+ start:1428 stop:2114 length:687 start_codon:yes stop_codon:yes gene_type:complete